MRWLYFTSKTSRAVQPEFWPSLCSFSGWSGARDVPQFSLEAYPCCCKQKESNNATFSQSGPTCQWLFFPILRIFPLFPSFLAFIFIGCLVLYPVHSGAQVKKAVILFPISFCEEVRARNIYSYSYQRSCKPCLSTVWFWRFSLCCVWVMWNSIMQRLIWWGKLT